MAVIPQSFKLQRSGGIPNNGMLPVLIYRKILEAREANKDKLFQQHFAENDWQGIWKADIYDYDHFHPASHEALGIAQGQARLQLGGKDGKVIDVDAGDLLVLPAGTGHKKVSGSENLAVIGAYPAGQEKYEICRSLAGCSDALEQIENLALPETDPFYGKDGPLISLWKL